MTVSSSVPIADPSASAAPDLADVDRSFRAVAFFLLGKASFWGVAGSLFLLLASVKLHAPSMMTEQAWLTYGRIYPAGWAMLVYGFAGQAAFAAALWVLARAAGQRLHAPVVALVGGVLWNIGLLAGVIGILLGHSTGRELLEMPAGTMAILVLGGALIGAAGWATFASRTIEETYPSAWFALLALLAWAGFSSATFLMYSGEGVRGVLQALVQRWYAAGILRLWLGGMALAVILHVFPLVAGRPLASRQLAIWTFWSLALFAPWMATEHGDPFPRWVVSLGMAGRTLGVIGLVALALNLWKTAEGAWGTVFSTLTGKLVGVAAIAYVAHGGLEYLFTLRIPEAIVGGALDFMPAPPPPNVILRMTWVHQGMDWLLVGGAAILSAIAVAPEVFRRGCGRAFSPGLIRTHAWLTLIGVALIALPLLGAGVIQGLLLAGGERPFLDALRASLGLVRISTLGYAAFFFGQVALFLAALGAAREAAAECVAMARDWAGPAGAGEARARS